MLNYIIKRLLQLIPPLFGLTIILFVLLRIGGDPIYHLVDPEASAEEIEEVRIAYGFDKPLIVQYFNQLKMVQFSLSENQRWIKNGIARELSRVIGNEEDRIEVSLLEDIEYHKAVDIIKDLKEYYSILEF